jgi:hypothetical protein
VKDVFDLDEKDGPDLSQVQSKFSFGAVRAKDWLHLGVGMEGLGDWSSAFIVNEIGSVHVSFTRDEVSLSL